MDPYVIIEKAIGETPLVALTKWREEHPDYADVPISYAGRLDPMASGKLLLVLGEECKRQGSYTGLDKEYEIELLFDVGSDTGDALGLIEYSEQETLVCESELHNVLKGEIGAHQRAYPIFSSKTVRGKPLFLYALEGSIETIDIPEHIEEIYSIIFIQKISLSTNELVARIDDFLAKVPVSLEPSKQLGADFRSIAVRASWRAFFKQAGERTFSVITLRVACGSGTYMRSLAPRVGTALGTRALALSITRTAINL